MDLELFAQFARQNVNNPAFRAGLIVGIIFAVLISGGIPIAVGSSRGHPVLGLVGGVFAGGVAVFLGCLGGLPVVLVFVAIILALGDPPRKKRSRKTDDNFDYDFRDDDDDDYRRPWGIR